MGELPACGGIHPVRTLFWQYAFYRGAERGIYDGVLFSGGLWICAYQVVWARYNLHAGDGDADDPLHRHPDSTIHSLSAVGVDWHIQPAYPAGVGCAPVFYIPAAPVL